MGDNYLKGSDWWAEGASVMEYGESRDAVLVADCFDAEEAERVVMVQRALSRALAAERAKVKALVEAAKRFRDTCELTNTHHNHRALCDLNAALAAHAEKKETP